MTMWLMRAGKSGEREGLALQEGIAMIGWEELPDLTGIRSRAELGSLLRRAYPDEKARTLNNWHAQIWSVRDSIQEGDLVVLPLKSRPSVALGTVCGSYEYRTDLDCGPLHTRRVSWVTELPRRAFDMDVLLSFGAFMTVCRIERNDAEERVRALLEGRAPLPSRAAAPSPDLAARAHLLIRERISQRFRGHALAALVAAVLEAQGYKARLSPPGPDGGVDILAGSGPLGFDAPRMVVQVKSQDSPVDVRLLRELAGVMGRFRADHALLGRVGGVQPAGAGGGGRRIISASGFGMRGTWCGAIKEHYDAAAARGFGLKSPSNRSGPSFPTSPRRLQRSPAGCPAGVVRAGLLRVPPFKRRHAMPGTKPTSVELDANEVALIVGEEDGSMTVRVVPATELDDGSDRDPRALRDRGGAGDASAQRPRFP